MRQRRIGRHKERKAERQRQQSHANRHRNTSPAQAIATPALRTAVLPAELGHFSGHEKRLNRQFGKRFADDAYCMEELTAELCSAFLCAELGITVGPITRTTSGIGPA
jgi:antirestriction protein ArdC